MGNRKIPIVTTEANGFYAKYNGVGFRVTGSTSRNGEYSIRLYRLDYDLCDYVTAEHNFGNGPLGPFMLEESRERFRAAREIRDKTRYMHNCPEFRKEDVRTVYRLLTRYVQPKQETQATEQEIKKLEERME